MGVLADLVREGKVKAIGHSDVSAATLRKAQTVHPIAAVQNEYSPWSRNVELGVLDATREGGSALTCFSPAGRGFFAGAVRNFDDLAENDLRRSRPRFQGANLQRNLDLLARFEALARKAGCTPAQLSLAWVLSRSDHVMPVPGTTSLRHLEANFAARELAIEPPILAEVDHLMTPQAVAGARYPRADSGGGRH